MDTHFRFSRATKAVVAAVTAASLVMSPVTALACTQVYVGPKLTATGETIYGRSEDAKTLVKNDDGTINVAKSYGLEDEGAGQDTRYVQGHKFFGDKIEASKDYTLNDKGQVETIANPQLFFTPSRSDYGVFDMLRSVAARGEGTDVDANKNSELYAIGNNRTVSATSSRRVQVLTPRSQPCSGRLCRAASLACTSLATLHC